MLFFPEPICRPIPPLKWWAEKYNPLYQKVYKINPLKHKTPAHKNLAFWVRQFNKFNFPLQAPNEIFHHFAKLTEKSGFLSQFHPISGQIRVGSPQAPH